MAANYKRFMVSPNSSLLAEDAALLYVTTATSFKGATEIIKHLSVLQKQVDKKQQDVISQIESRDAIALEVNTVMEFRTSGGTYLPGLDDNFVSDRVASLPITHFVHFNGEGKISQIRLSWDQGALLKQIEIIGKSGRNWPIVDPKEQVKLIQNALKSVASTPQQQDSHDHNQKLVRTRGNSTNALRDPHSTLHLPVSREEIENAPMNSVISPFAGSRPEQRSFTDILGDEPDSPSANRDRNMSPAKRGQGKNHQPMRLYDEQDVEEDDSSESRPTSSYIRPNPTKYNHFDFADGSDPRDAPKAGVPFDEKPKTKKDSSWSFDDFTTPAKPKATKVFRHQDVRHWDTDHDTFSGQTPAIHGRGRRDAESQFEMQDDGVRPPGQERPLGNITNTKARGTEPHFTMADESPLGATRREKVSEGRQKAVNNMGANWSNYDQSPQQKENTRASQPQGDTRIHIAGNGMGANKKATTEFQKDQGINIAGDGMGGRKGTERNWLYGDDI